MDNFFVKKYPCLENKSFRLFLLSQLLSQSGGYIQNVALSALITDLTGSRTKLGLFLCVAYAPVFAFSYFAGRLTAKIPPKTLLIITELCLFGLSVFLIFAAKLSFGGYLAFGAVWGTVRAFQSPCAASVPKLLCDGAQLHSGVTTLSLAMSLSRAAGPVISGLLYTSLSYRAAYFANALSYVPSVILLCKIKSVGSKSQSPEVRSPLRLNPYLLAAVFTVSLIGTAYNVIFTGLSCELRLSPVWFSVFMSLIGAGAVIGAVIMSKPRSALWACLGISLCAALMAMFKNVWLICLAAVVYGMCDYLFFTCALARIQRQNDSGSIARAMGIYTIVTTGALPMGFLILGYLTQKFPISAVLGIIAAVCGGIYLIFSRKFVDN